MICGNMVWDGQSHICATVSANVSTVSCLLDADFSVALRYGISEKQYALTWLPICRIWSSTHLVVTEASHV